MLRAAYTVGGGFRRLRGTVLQNLCVKILAGNTQATKFLW